MRIDMAAIGSFEPMPEVLPNYLAPTVRNDVRIPRRGKKRRGCSAPRRDGALRAVAHGLKEDDNADTMQWRVALIPDLV